jgi:hypothetical protein
MKVWMKKLLVALVAIATLGTYTPTALLGTENSENDLSQKTSVGQEEISETEEKEEETQIVAQARPDYLQLLQNEAKAQSLLKFGPRIKEQVENEFNEIILPEMEKMLENIATDAGEDGARYLGITEQPAKGYGERIFHVTDFRTDKDVLRFHVRRENRPIDGYYFNFHYHLAEDNFKAHHPIGEIYWAKNTPPKWMA